MTDIIRTTAITSAMFLTAISPMSADAKDMIVTPITSTVHTAVVTNLYDTNDGSVGRLTIGSYTAELYASSSQAVVDAADSAAYMNWGKVTAIADHASDGFRIIRSIGAGTVGTITDNSTITYITMVSSYQGKNSGKGIDLADGRYAELVTDGDYCLYTCNDSTGIDVTVTYWRTSGTEAVAQPAPEPVVEAAPVQQAPEAAPVQAAVEEAPVQETAIEAAPAETQQVVDTTVTEQTQQSQIETTAAAQNTSSEVKAEVSDTSAPEFAEKTNDSHNMSAAVEEALSNPATANSQGVSQALRSIFERTAYYADNRRWLALASADQSESNIVA